MRRIRLCLVGLILVLVLTQTAVTSSDVSSYDLMADINRDRIIDASDLARLGNAYGSSLVLPSEPNKTVVTVLSFDKEPPKVENARVAIIDVEVFWDSAVEYTNSSGIATFKLTANKNYTAIAWSGAAFNYANFTTNSDGEASVMIILRDPSVPPIRALPQGWILVTTLKNETGLLYTEALGAYYYNLECTEFHEDTGSYWSGECIASYFTYGGIFFVPPFYQANEPHSRIGIVLSDEEGTVIGYSVYSPDENGCANVIVYVTPP